MVAIERVIPYARNPRVNGDRSIAAVAASLKEFGWRQPIVVDSEFVIVVGHTRLLAALSLGMTEVPIHIATELTAEQVKAYRIADNRLSEDSEFDTARLAQELQDLLGEEYDLTLTALTPSEIDLLLAPAAGNLLNPSLATSQGDRHGIRVDSFLNVGKHKIPMTAMETDAMVAWVEEYIQNTGSVSGLWTALLDLNEVAATEEPALEN
jgi:hypothetical protein